jgi:predicted transposase/invertase (TIGR01784 family)
MEIVFYELPKVEKHVREYEAGKGKLDELPAEEKWCIYMRYKGNERMAGLIEELSRQEAGIMNAERALKKMNRDREQWARTLWREKRAMDYQDYQLGIKEALAEGRKEARAAGLAEGRVEGRTEGLAEGRAEGLAEGLNGLRKTAKKLKSMGLSAEQIADATGLALEEVKKL